MKVEKAVDVRAHFGHTSAQTVKSAGKFNGRRMYNPPVYRNLRIRSGRAGDRK